MSWIDGVRDVWRSLARRAPAERDLDDEMAFHLEMEAAKLQREGHDAAEARRLARVRFGGVERMKERTRDARGTRWLEDLVADLRYGLRSLARVPSFTATAVLTLSLGIGATTGAFSLVDGVLLRPLPFHEPERLVELRELGGRRRFYPTYPNFADWRASARAFDGMISVQPGGVEPVLDAGDPTTAPVLGVSRDFLAVLGVSPVVGRDFTAEENAPGGADVALVSHRFWTSRLGAEPDLERVDITVFGSRYRVVGVLPPGFRFLQEADVYYPHERTVRSGHAYRVVGRLADGVTAADAKAEMDGLARAIQEAHPGESQAGSVHVRPLEEVVLGAQTRPLGLLMLAATLVLLVACANVASALLARGSARLREFAVRASLGARRGRLVRQVLAETLLLAGLGAAGGALVAWAAVELAAAFGPQAVPRLSEVQVGLRSLAFTGGLALATALLFGVYPALRLGRGSAGSLLGTRGADRPGRGRMWSVLLAGEAAFAVVLLVAASLLLRSVRQIVVRDMGWEPEGVLEMAVTLPGGIFGSEEEATTFLSRLRTGLAAIPAVEAVGIGNFLPLHAGSWTAPVREAGTGPRSDNYTGWRLVDGGYFRSLSIPLVQGRLLAPGDADVGVVNRTLARILWGEDGDALGRFVLSSFDATGRPIRVVGVVEDARDWQWQEPQPELYVPWWAYASQLRGPVRYVLRTAGDPSEVIPAARERLRALDPRVPAELQTLSGALSASAGDRRFVSGVLLGFAAAGLFLGMVGVFGVVAHTAAQRRREIGIRMALGAQGSRVRAEVRAAALRAVGAGTLIGAVISVASAGYLEGLLYEVPARDPLTLLMVVAAFLACAVLASDLPARASTRVDPSLVLKED